MRHVHKLAMIIIELLMKVTVFFDMRYISPQNVQWGVLHWSSQLMCAPVHHWKLRIPNFAQRIQCIRQVFQRVFLMWSSTEVRGLVTISNESSLHARQSYTGMTHLLLDTCSQLERVLRQQMSTNIPPLPSPTSSFCASIRIEYYIEYKRCTN